MTPLKALTVCSFAFVSCTYTAADVNRPSLVRTTEKANCTELLVLDAENNVWTQSACDSDRLALQRRTTIPLADELRARFAALAETPPECVTPEPDVRQFPDVVTYEGYDGVEKTSWTNCNTVGEAPWPALDEAFEAL
ncbi:MAG: hypothetical protein ACO1OB_34060 [Archangium sp.]